MQSPCLECYSAFAWLQWEKDAERIVLQLPGQVALSSAASSANPRIHNLHETRFLPVRFACWLFVTAAWAPRKINAYWSQVRLTRIRSILWSHAEILIPDDLLLHGLSPNSSPCNIRCQNVVAWWPPTEDPLSLMHPFKVIWHFVSVFPRFLMAGQAEKKQAAASSSHCITKVCRLGEAQG